jgi:hypothetical protein
LAQLPLLQTLLLQLFLGQVMADGAAGHRPHDRMMARHVACHGTDRRALQATASRGIR